MEKHITSSLYLICKIGGKVKALLHKHQKHKIWVGVGGHVEIWENPYECALREAEEETGVKVKIFKNARGLKSLTAVSEVPSPFMIKEEKIPKYGNQYSHYHVDLVYFGTTDSPEEVSMDEEFGWFSKQDIEKLDVEEDVKFVALSALKQYRSYIKN